MSGDDVPVGEDELQAYVDDRLPAQRRAEVEAFLARHPEQREEIAAQRRQRAALRTALHDKLVEPVPARLSIAGLQAARRARVLRRAGLAAAAVAIFFVGAGAGWFANDQRPAGGTVALAPTSGIAQGATAAYRTFVVEVAHPVEVGAAQEAHLMQWLSKRLGRKLEAPDLAPFGYRLIGGRLLPASSSAAAQLMYEDGTGRRLTLYVRAADGTETAFRFQKDGDAATFAWIDQGFGFAVTAMASREELLPIAEAIYKGLTSKG